MEEQKEFDPTQDLIDVVNLKFDQEKEIRRLKRNKRKARLRKNKK